MRSKLGSLAAAGAIALTGLLVTASPAQAATCDGDWHDITVDGGWADYICRPGGLVGDVKDTRPDGKCAYVDVWENSNFKTRYHACGWNNMTSYDYDYVNSVHVLLFVI